MYSELLWEIDVIQSLLGFLGCDDCLNDGVHVLVVLALDLNLAFEHEFGDVCCAGLITNKARQILELGIVAE